MQSRLKYAECAHSGSDPARRTFYSLVLKQQGPRRMIDVWSQLGPGGGTALSLLSLLSLQSLAFKFIKANYIQKKTMSLYKKTMSLSLNPTSFSLFHFLFLFSFYFLSLPAGTSSLPVVGITYTHDPRHYHDHDHTRPTNVASILHSLKLSAVRLPESDPSVVRDFSYSNISLLINIPNSLIPAIASNRSNALQWLYHHVIPFYPRSKVATISVGNDILDNSLDLTDYLLPAMRNVQLGLRDLGIHKISVSTTFSFLNIVTTSFPPSAAEFQDPASELLIKPLLEFLDDTNSSFLVNLYPYNVYRLNSEIPIGFALFQQHPYNYRDDLTTGVRYRNLFDMMVDSVVSAMAVAGHENIPVIVAETGWPSSGDALEIDASPAYAEMYINGLVSHLSSGLGTPLRREGVTEAYIYELFDRETRQGSDSGRHWGIMYPNMTAKYKVAFSGSVTLGYSGGWVGGLFTIAALLSLFQL